MPAPVFGSPRTNPPARPVFASPVPTTNIGVSNQTLMGRIAESLGSGSMPGSNAAGQPAADSGPEQLSGPPPEAAAQQAQPVQQAQGVQQQPEKTMAQKITGVLGYVAGGMGSGSQNTGGMAGPSGGIGSAQPGATGMYPGVGQTGTSTGVELYGMAEQPPQQVGSAVPIFNETPSGPVDLSPGNQGNAMFIKQLVQAASSAAKMGMGG